ncbi:MAG: hypothetical protein BMS9Abin25_1640 [Gammaproteobacteria bacterium]|nr:MAG: hypothetical protein BMS9Abin25_1640 [Gammaproteobacteria bacterium]
MRHLTPLCAIIYEVAGHPVIHIQAESSLTPSGSVNNKKESVK